MEGGDEFQMPMVLDVNTIGQIFVIGGGAFGHSFCMVCLLTVGCLGPGGVDLHNSLCKFI